MEEEEFVPVFQVKFMCVKEQLELVREEFNTLGCDVAPKPFDRKVYHMWFWPMDQRVGFFKDEENYKAAEGHLEKLLSEVLG